MRLRFWLLALLTTASMQLHAAELGLSAADTAALLEQQDEQMLFIDVRDPVEIMFVGTPLGIDANIPFLMVDRHDFDADNNRFRLNQNPDFADQVAAALEAEGPQQGMRTLNGWQNEGQAWQPRIDPETIYRP